MTKHEGFTPGPWSYRKDSCAQCDREGVAEFIIDGPLGAFHGQFSLEADAALIADAPALLAERDRLKILLRRVDRLDILGSIPGGGQLVGLLQEEIKAALKGNE